MNTIDPSQTEAFKPWWSRIGKELPGYWWHPRTLTALRFLAVVSVLLGLPFVALALARWQTWYFLLSWRECALRWQFAAPPLVLVALTVARHVFKWDWLGRPLDWLRHRLWLRPSWLLSVVLLIGSAAGAAYYVEAHVTPIKWTGLIQTFLRGRSDRYGSFGELIVNEIQPFDAASARRLIAVKDVFRSRFEQSLSGADVVRPKLPGLRQLLLAAERTDDIDNPLLRMADAELCSLQADWECADQRYEELLASRSRLVTPDISASSALNRANVLLYRKRYGPAIPIFENFADSASKFQNLSVAYTMTGQLQKAEEAATLGLRWLKDHNLELTYGEAKQGLLSNRCAIRLRRNDRTAMADCEEARDLDPLATDVHANIVLLKLASNDLPGATVALHVAKVCDPCLALLQGWVLEARHQPGFTKQYGRALAREADCAVASDVHDDLATLPALKEQICDRIDDLCQPGVSELPFVRAHFSCGAVPSK